MSIDTSNLISYNSSLNQKSVFPFKTVLVITLLVIGILAIGVAFFLYFQAQFSCISYAVGGGGLFFDGIVGSATFIYLLIPKKADADSDITMDQTYIIGKLKGHEGVSSSRNIYLVKEAGETKFFIKTVPHNFERHDTALSEEIAYYISENMGLHVVPRTYYYAEGREAQKDLFNGSEAFSFLRSKKSIVIQEALIPDQKTSANGLSLEEKHELARGVKCDVTSAHQAIVFNFTLGRYDNGVSRYENSVVDLEGRVWEIDNDLIGREITSNLNWSKDGKDRPDLRTTWIVENRNVKDIPFSDDFKQLILNIDKESLFIGMEQINLNPEFKTNVENNLCKVQTVFRNPTEILTPSVLHDKLKYWGDK